MFPVVAVGPDLGVSFLTHSFTVEGREDSGDRDTRRGREKKTGRRHLLGVGPGMTPAATCLIPVCPCYGYWLSLKWVQKGRWSQERVVGGRSHGSLSRTVSTCNGWGRLLQVLEKE